MKRFSIGEGEANFEKDKSMIVNDIEMQVKELEMDRDQLLNEKLILQEQIRELRKDSDWMTKMVMAIDQKRNAAEGEIDDLQEEYEDLKDAFDHQTEKISELY